MNPCQVYSRRPTSKIVVLSSPASFENELSSLKAVGVIRDLKTATEATFSLAFSMKQEEIDALAITRKVEGGSIVGFAYTQGGSKKYES